MCVSSYAVAYLDPGTGSVVLQFLVGGILGGLLILKLCWRRLVAFFSGKKNEPQETSEQAK